MAHLILHGSSSPDLLGHRHTLSPKINMKSFIVFAALVAVALAAVPHRRQILFPPHKPNQIVIVRETPSNNVGLDNYRFSYEQSDGQRREESAQVEARSNPEESVLRVQGSYSYVADDGQTYSITYIADENGFQPQGAHLPVAPVASFQ